MTEKITPPDWIYPDAPVILRSQEVVVHTRVLRVTAKNFTVEGALTSSGRPAQISLKSNNSGVLRSGWQGSQFEPFIFYVYPADSEEALGLLAASERRLKRERAAKVVTDAYKDWTGRPGSKLKTNALVLAGQAMLDVLRETI